MRKKIIAAALAAGLAAVAVAAQAPDGSAQTGQARAQVERALLQRGIEVPGGVDSLSDRQVLELLLVVNIRPIDPMDDAQIRKIIRRR